MGDIGNMSKLVRVSDAVYSKLSQIAQVTGYSRQDIIDKAIRSLERKTILKQANEAYTYARSNKKDLLEEDPFFAPSYTKSFGGHGKAMADTQEELDVWESTLEDGLENE